MSATTDVRTSDHNYRTRTKLKLLITPVATPRLTCHSKTRHVGLKHAPSAKAHKRETPHEFVGYVIERHRVLYRDSISPLILSGRSVGVPKREERPR